MSDVRRAPAHSDEPSLTCCWISPPGAGRNRPFFLPLAACGSVDDAARAHCHVLIRSGRPEMAEGLLEDGFGGVMLGDAALDDATCIERLAARFGSARVGIGIAAARLEMSWTLDRESNSQFSVMTPSVGQPDWEVLYGTGQRTGTLVGWWLAQMFERGAGSAVLFVDVDDDVDLNLAAGLRETHGARIRFAPHRGRLERLDDLIRWSGIRSFAAPWRESDVLAPKFAAWTVSHAEGAEPTR